MPNHLMLTPNIMVSD